MPNKTIDIVLRDRAKVHHIENVVSIQHAKGFVCFVESFEGKNIAHYFNRRQVLCFTEKVQDDKG